MDQSVIESIYFADCPNKSSEVKADLACKRVARCVQTIVQRVGLALLILALPNVAFLGIILSPDTLEAATIAAASCNKAAVKTAITAAQNGDTVLIPPGTCTWTGPGLDSDCQFGTEANRDNTFCFSSTSGNTKYITIQGAGIGQTVIIDQIDKTIPAQNVFRWILSPGGLSRITGIEIRTGTNIGCGGGKANISINGTSSQFRIDHSKFVIRDNCRIIGISGYIRGVADHNTFDISLGGDAVVLYHPTWGGFPNDLYGDHSWALPDTVGTAEAFYLEDNIFLNDQSLTFFRYAMDFSSGSRVVIRYNSFRGGAWYSDHGLDTGARADRQFEVYNNTWRGVDGESPLDLKFGTPQNPNNSEAGAIVASRGGVGVVFNNSVITTNGTISPFSFSAIYFGVPADGRGRAGGWGFCNGTNPLDQNAGMSPASVNNAGRRCTDQTGSGYGTQLMRTFNASTPPINTVTGTQSWSQQVAQPTYVWNNTVNGVIGGGSVNTVGGTSPIIMGTDIINGVRPGYTAFTYPHPLTTGSTTSGPAPSPPSGLRVQ